MLETIDLNIVADGEWERMSVGSGPSVADLGVRGHWEPGPASRRRHALPGRASPFGGWQVYRVGESITWIHPDRVLAGDWEKSADPDGDKDDDSRDGDDDDDVFPDDEEGDDGGDFDDDDDDDDDDGDSFEETAQAGDGNRTIMLMRTSP